MHNPHDPRVLPMREGVSPSCVVLPSAGQGAMIDFLCERLPSVSRAQWLQTRDWCTLSSVKAAIVKNVAWVADLLLGKKMHACHAAVWRCQGTQ